MRNINIIWILAVFALYGCNNNDDEVLASGVFEATEVIVSAEATGKLLSFDISEGQSLDQNQEVGIIDSTQLYLSKLQLIANKQAVLASKPDVSSQIEATIREIKKNEFEKQRIQKLLAGDAATQKQLDDIDAQLNILNARLKAQKNSLGTNLNSIDAQSKTIDVQVQQIEDQLNKCKIYSPIDGTVLVKYAEPGELTASGKALFKMANIDQMILQAYVTSDRLAELKIGQQVEVLAEFGETETRSYPGTISWISSKSEFTPKTIQTQDERANLVYAVKIAVENDGYLKIGMYGGFKI